MRYIAGGYSSAAFNYKTSAFDGSFYTGFHAWRQYREFGALKTAAPEAVNAHRSPKMPQSFEGEAFILSCGHEGAWQKIAATRSLWLAKNPRRACAFGAASPQILAETLLELGCRLRRFCACNQTSSLRLLPVFLMGQWNWRIGCRISIIIHLENDGKVRRAAHLSLLKRKDHRRACAGERSLPLHSNPTWSLTKWHQRAQAPFQ